MTHRFALVAFLLAGSACDPNDRADDPDSCELDAALTPAQAVDGYRSAWTREDEAQGDCLLRQSLSPEVVLWRGDEFFEGRESVERALQRRMEELSEQGERRSVNVLGHLRHHEALVEWAVVSEAGAVEPEQRGQDWIEFDDQGRIERVHVFTGEGVAAAPPEALAQWEAAWTTDDADQRRQAIDNATTDDVHFTDLLSEVVGRDGLVDEIAEQRVQYVAGLELADEVEVFGEPASGLVLLRVSAQVELLGTGTLHVIDFVRLREGRVERLAGFGSEAP